MLKRTKVDHLVRKIDAKEDFTEVIYEDEDGNEWDFAMHVGKTGKKARIGIYDGDMFEGDCYQEEIIRFESDDIASIVGKMLEDFSRQVHFTLY